MNIRFSPLILLLFIYGNYYAMETPERNTKIPPSLYHQARRSQRELWSLPRDIETALPNHPTSLNESGPCNSSLACSLASCCCITVVSILIAYFIIIGKHV